MFQLSYPKSFVWGYYGCVPVSVKTVMLGQKRQERLQPEAQIPGTEVGERA